MPFSSEKHIFPKPYMNMQNFSFYFSIVFPHAGTDLIPYNGVVDIWVKEIGFGRNPLKSVSWSRVDKRSPWMGVYL